MRVADQVTESVKLQEAFGFNAGKARNYPECVFGLTLTAT